MDSLIDFNKVTEKILAQLESIVGEKYVFTDEDAKEKYGRDETEDLCFLPEVIVKPANANEISAILKLCNGEKIPVTPRAAGTGLSGGALPVHGGISLSVERLNKIILIDERNSQVTVEPGVITQVLQEAVREKKLFYPPDPSSRGSCFIGGNVAENAGGPKAVKYGVVKDYVLNLEIVLPTGEIIWTGANVLKNSTGYNLTQLLVGSEGTLGIITKIVLKLIPYPEYDLLMLVPFPSSEKACEAVGKIFQNGFTPSGLEFMERDAIDLALQFMPDVRVPIGEHIQAHLLIEVDGHDLDFLYKEIDQISALLESLGCEEILFADNAQQKADLWRLRRTVAEAVKSHSVYKEEDTVVPRAELPKLINGVKEIGRRYGFKSFCYGHAGDGNLHVNIIKGDMNEKDWNEKIPLGIREIFELVVSLGGTLSGEHGIGWVQKNYMNIAFDAAQLKLMKQIKNVFDPNHILNPGKIFP